MGEVYVGFSWFGVKYKWVKIKSFKVIVKLIGFWCFLKFLVLSSIVMLDLRIIGCYELCMYRNWVIFVLYFKFVSFLLGGMVCF